MDEGAPTAGVPTGDGARQPVTGDRPTYPALRAWREELSRGERTTETFDALWCAACAEMNAQEAFGNCLRDAARQYLAEAAAILRKAADTMVNV